MLRYIDQLNKEIVLRTTPSRIISLVPSQTELLYDLGLNDKVIGITKFCVHPDTWFRGKTKIGGTKKVNISKVLELQPDLIIANKEENLREQITELEKIAPVWTSDIGTLEDVFQMIHSIGEMTGTRKTADSIVEKIRLSIEGIRNRAVYLRKIRTAYLIWKNPYMSAGGDTFIHEIMTLAGMQNVFADKTRYPEISIDEIRMNGTELLLLSSEPYPFRENHIAELAVELPGTKIVLVDGEMFSWYGSRMMHLDRYLQNFFTMMLQGNT